MTIADKIYKNDPKVLFNIIVIYRLRDLDRLYFLENVIDDDYQDRDTERLMTPGDYHGKSERYHGAVTQKHGLVLK